MRKYSGIKKVGKRSFRYNYEDAMLEYVCMPDKRLIEDNKEWQAKYGKDLWDVVDGYVIVAEIGLRRENWKDDPIGWCERYSEELDEELAYAVF